MQTAFGIFEGGGGKGLAHVGALRCAQDNGIEFIGIAGASAGAIVASLVACGYKAHEMFDPDRDDPSAVYAISVRDMLGLVTDAQWDQFKRAYKAPEDLPPKDSARHPWLGFAWRTWKFRRDHRKIVEAWERQQGVFDTRALEVKLNEKLVAGLLKNFPNDAKLAGFTGQEGEASRRRVLFEDVPVPLKIVATDVDGRKMVIFSKGVTPLFPVADAVGASVSLPFVFRPKELPYRYPDQLFESQIRTIDGGLLSNFPAWLFDAERADKGPHVPTLGFRLVQKPREDAKAKDISPVAAYLGNVVQVLITGDPLLETREIENLHEIPLKVSATTLSFDLTHSQKQELYEEGRVSALEAFGRPDFPRDRETIQALLAAVLELFRTLVGLRETTLLRANIVRRTTRKSLRVTYTCNMNSADDSDDRLEFPLNSGACGRCWGDKDNPPQLVACNLDEVRASTALWNMDKYQQALVRSDLKALLCLPIVDNAGACIAVLSIDSTDAGIFRFLDDTRAAGDFREHTMAPLSEFLMRKPLEK